jgi:putative Holliday junction resolvase
MKVLGIDYGEKYIGVAVGDTESRIAMPKTVIFSSSKEKVRDLIAALIDETGAERIIVGLPLSFKMQETSLSKKARAFGHMLRRELGIALDFENEVLSSLEAERLNKDLPKRRRHAVAASLILQSWLDRHSEQ